MKALASSPGSQWGLLRWWRMRQSIHMIRLTYKILCTLTENWTSDISVFPSSACSWRLACVIGGTCHWQKKRQAHNQEQQKKKDHSHPGDRACGHPSRQRSKHRPHLIKQAHTLTNGLVSLLACIHACTLAHTGHIYCEVPEKVDHLTTPISQLEVQDEWRDERTQHLVDEVHLRKEEWVWPKGRWVGTTKNLQLWIGTLV